MTDLIIVAPLPVAGISASRGTGILNLLTDDPKEVWADDATGAVSMTIDLGAVRSIDTIFLGHIHGADASATWTIEAGASDYGDAVIKAAGPLRVPDSAGQSPAMTHALWTGWVPIEVRYIRLTLDQPGASLVAGVLLVGRAFRPALGREWGSGRRVIDTGTVTPLASGGYGISEGACKRALSWTFGDLVTDEVDALEAIALDRGESRPVLVVENSAVTTGLRGRIFYGLFQRFTAFERRNRAQTRWELGIDEWI